MAKLILMFNKQVQKEIPFLQKSMTIGRKSENDIHIDNLAVSGLHAKIDKVGNEYILTDLQSTNGIFLNENKVASHKLKNGDHITVGKHTLIFLGDQKPETGDAEATQEMDLDKTMMLDTVTQRELLAKQKTPPPVSQPPEKIGILSFIDGSKLGEIKLSKKLTRLGKSDTSEIKLPGLFMGPTAATISKRPSGYTLSYTGGIAKLKLNGQVIRESTPLKDFDTIELGSYRFQFYQQEAGQATEEKT